MDRPFWKSRGFAAQVGVTLVTLGGAVAGEMPWGMAGGIILVSWGLFLQQVHARAKE